MLEVIFNSGYELFMHGRFRGPNNKVEKKYTNYLDLLAADIRARTYGGNLLFRRHEDWTCFINTTNNNSRDAELSWTCTFPLIIARN